MFEKILEKVIESYFGKYINGIDKNIHLSVFKGSVKIENVSFKPEIMDLLELPIDILFSNIGQMTMNIPWSKLSSSPVPISLENIYLIIGPKKQSNWNFVDKSTIEKKLENINAYAKQCLDKLIQKNQSEEKGTLEKMTIKIIDNIQLSFKNLHIRWEDNQKNYSFGLTLQELQANTTDENWKQTFIDRTKPEEANKPINKLLNLTNLRIYWNQNEDVFLQNAKKDKRDQKMQSLIEDARKTKNVEVIIEINADFKLINNQPQNFESPLYELTIGLDWIDLQLRHQQLQQISDLFNLSIEYRTRLWAESNAEYIIIFQNASTNMKSYSIFKKLIFIYDSKIEYYLFINILQRKKVVEITDETKEFYKKHFMKIYFMKLKLKQQGEKDQLDSSQQQILDSILNIIDYPTLNSWVRSVVKLLGRENKLKEIIKNKTGFFNQNVNISIPPEQIKQIEVAIEKQLEQTKKNIVQRPDESIQFCTSFILKGGTILLTKDNVQKQLVEGIKLTYSDLIIYANTTEDNGQEIFVKLQEIGINLQNQDFDSKIPESINFLYRAVNQKKQSSSNFVQFIYKRHSLRQKNQCKDNLDGSITCFVEPIECVYNHKFIERFKDFFDIKSQHQYFSEKKLKLEQLSAFQKNIHSNMHSNSSIQQNSKDNIQSIPNTPKSREMLDNSIDTPTNKSLSTPKNIEQNNQKNIDAKKQTQVNANQIFKLGVDFRVESQTIIIPLSDTNPEKPCWIFTLARANFRSSELKRDIYQLFNLDMKNMSIYYLKQRSLLHRLPSLVNNHSDVHKVIENYNFHLTVLHQDKNQVDVDKPLLQFEGVLDPLCINFNEETISEVMKIKDLISLSYQNEQEKLRQKKEELEKNAKLNCSILYRQKRYQKQSNAQFLIDSTDRLHIFYSENHSAVSHLNPFLNMHLNNLIDYTIMEDIKNKKDSFCSQTSKHDSQQPSPNQQQQQSDEQKESQQISPKDIKSNKNQNDNQDQSFSQTLRLQQSQGLNQEEQQPQEELKQKSTDDLQQQQSDNLKQKSIDDIRSIEDIKQVSMEDIQKSLKDQKQISKEDVQQKSMEDIKLKSKEDIKTKSAKDLEQKSMNDLKQKSMKDTECISTGDIDQILPEEIHFINKNKDQEIFKREMERVKLIDQQRKEQEKDKEIEQLEVNLDTEEDGSLSEEDTTPKVRGKSSTIQLPEINEQIDNISNLFNVSFKSLMVKVEKNDSPYIDFILQNVSLYRLISSQSSTTNIQFQNLKIEDYIFKYNHEIFQPIFSTMKNQCKLKNFILFFNQSLILLIVQYLNFIHSTFIQILSYFLQNHNHLQQIFY